MILPTAIITERQECRHRPYLHDVPIPDPVFESISLAVLTRSISFPIYEVCLLLFAHCALAHLHDEVRCFTPHTTPVPAASYLD